MKSYNNLGPQITSFENLYRAFLKARRGKRARPDVAEFEYQLETNLFSLQEELLTGSYRPGGYRSFIVSEPVRRKISAAPFRDRVVHHALCRVIEPLFDRIFIHDSYACRAGKGTHRAIDRCQKYVGRYPYVLKADISNFFPSLDHDILYSLFEKRLRCRETLKLMRLILDSGENVLTDEYRMAWFPGDDLVSPLTRPRGLPIGNLTSQFWANLYLHELDAFVTRALGWRPYLRYVDDFLLFADRKDELHKAYDRIAEFLARLRLKLHPTKTRVFPTSSGVDFLGFVIFADHRRIRRTNLVWARRRFRQLERDYAASLVSIDRVGLSIRSWIAHAKHAQSLGLRRQMIESLIFSRDDHANIADFSENLRLDQVAAAAH